MCLVGAAIFQLQSSVLPMVFLVTVVSNVFRSLTRSSHVALGWFSTFVIIILTRQDLALSLRVTDGHFIVFHFQIIASAVVTFSPSFLLMVLWPTVALAQVYSLLTDFLWQLFVVAHGSGKVGMEETDFVDTRALYTSNIHNKLRSGISKKWLTDWL